MRDKERRWCIGVLALQGDFREHAAILSHFKKVDVIEIRLPEQLLYLDGLIIPGGESTTICRLLKKWGLYQPIRHLAKTGKLAVWGTCAGAILLSRQTSALDVTSLDLMDITVKRNAFGRQIDSFIVSMEATPFSTPFSAVFIRAPLITEVGRTVDVLAKLDDERIVAARQGKLLATSFHPELTQDNRWHRYFLDDLVSYVQ